MVPGGPRSQARPTGRYLRASQPADGDRVARDLEGRRSLCAAGSGVSGAAPAVHAAGSGTAGAADTAAVARGFAADAGADHRSGWGLGSDRALWLRNPQLPGVRTEPSSPGLCDLHLRLYGQPLGSDERASGCSESSAVDAGGLPARSARSSTAEDAVQL